MDLTIFTVKLLTHEKLEGTPAQLRGFFATRFTDYPLLHQHVADRLIYDYPRVQYKFINGAPLIMGIDEGASVLMKIYDSCDSLQLGETRYDVAGMEFKLTLSELALRDKPIAYRFLTPWLALNQKNYKRFYGCKNAGERRSLLSGILTGNILAMCKSFDYQVDERIETTVSVRARKAHLKGVNVIAFDGTFVTNVVLPDLIGLGKSVSRGNGVVERCK